MAGVELLAAPLNGITLAAGTAETVLMIKAPANQALVVSRIILTTELTDPAAAPGTLLVYYYSSDGTMESTLTPRITGPLRNQYGGSAITVQSQAWTGVATPANEPTTDGLAHTPLKVDRGIDMFLPYKKEIIVPPGGRLGMKCTFTASVTVFPGLGYEE